MDIDTIDDTDFISITTTKSWGKKPSQVPIDDAHPFDLESYISAYSGMNIALFVTRNCL